MYATPQHWLHVHRCIILCMKSSHIVTRKRSSSCLPYTLYLLLSDTRPMGADSPTQFLMFNASCPVVAATRHVCSHLQAFAFTVLFLEPYSDRYFQCALLSLFTHFPIMEVFLDTHCVNTCPIIPLHCSSKSLSLLKMMLFN